MSDWFVPVHLVGSVPLGNSEEVFRAALGHIGHRLLRLPDGETGERSDWIAWQAEVFRHHSAFEETATQSAPYGKLPRFRLRPGVEVSTLKFGPLGYAQAAVESYRIWRRLAESDLIPSTMRFQVCLPSPFAVTRSFVEFPGAPSVEAPYEDALISELYCILDQLPADSLAVQFDVASELAAYEEVFAPCPESERQRIAERLASLGNRVPEAVELGYHLCYGDFEHQHFIQPTDAGHLVDLANRVTSGLSRPLHWLHLPVPRNRSDDDYFAPLQTLALPAGTQLFLGLVHLTDGVDGATRRSEAALRVVGRIGVATECGLGRRNPDVIPRLLALQDEVATAVENQIRELRRDVLKTAESMLRSGGYRSTTLDALARATSRSPRVIRDLFESRVGVVSKLADVCLAGDDAPIAIPDRPWIEEVKAETDPNRTMQLHARNARNLNDRYAWLHELIHFNAVTDADLAELWRIRKEQRITGQKATAAMMAAKGFLRPDVKVNRAADILWSLGGPDLYWMLVGERGWDPAEYQSFLADLLSAALLAIHDLTATPPVAQPAELRTQDGGERDANNDAAKGTMSSETLAKRFREMEDIISSKPEKIANTTVIYQFNIEGEEGGIWELQIDRGRVTVREGKADQPDMICTLILEDFLAMADGTVSGRDLFFSGRMGIQGNAMYGMLLGQLMSR